MKYTIESFFLRKFEEESDKILLEMPSFFSNEAVMDYVDQIASIRIEDFITYAEYHPNTNNISTKDNTQLSSFDDCTIGMCKIWKEDHEGRNLMQIAEALHGDRNYKNNPIALTKYGENQVKTACQLGLAFFRDNLWYLSSIGTIFLSLPDAVKYKFLSLSLLRDPFYSRVLCDMHRQEINLLDYMSILSKSTQKRRVPSCMRLINIFIQQCDIETVKINPITIKYN